MADPTSRHRSVYARGRRARALSFSLAFLLVPLSARAATEINNTRIIVNGFLEAGEWAPDETLFQDTPDGTPEESSVDSKWGRYNDINNIRLTWDADSLYVAVEGFIFDNNAMIFFDTLPLPDGQSEGLENLSSLNSWRRQVSFDNGFFPDAFLATWDNNTTPQLWQYQGLNNVTQVTEASLASVASFSRDLPGRVLEAAIPWSFLFLGQSHREFRPEYGDTVTVLPAGVTQIRLAAWITTGSDGGGGPDSAPDNLSGHQVDAGVPVVLDNYIIVTLDAVDAAGTAGADGVPDFGVPVRPPVSPDRTYEEIVDAFFFFPPPVRGQTLELDRLRFVDAQGNAGPRAIAPEAGDLTYFHFTVTPAITDSVLLTVRQLDFTAEIYDLDGDRVRTLYRNEPFSLSELYPPAGGGLPPFVLARNRFDGRDDHGAYLDAGIYLLRVVLEPNADEKKEAVVVVR